MEDGGWSGGWQREVLDLMEKNISSSYARARARTEAQSRKRRESSRGASDLPRKAASEGSIPHVSPVVHLVLDSLDLYGKYISFVKQFQKLNPDKCMALLCFGQLQLEHIAREARVAKELGWNGECCVIIPCSGQELDSTSCSVLEQIAAGEAVVDADVHYIEYWVPSNVWVFSRSMPDMSRANLKMWKVYSIENCPEGAVKKTGSPRTGKKVLKWLTSSNDVPEEQEEKSDCSHLKRMRVTRSMD